MRERATRGRCKTQLVDVARRFLETSRPALADALQLALAQRGIWFSFAERDVRLDWLVPSQ